ncbi:DUF3054 domain-containing protein [Corynebacterium marinum]|uniref:DUF3054 domain-containing protein n=1 Tax=Corynebacterium marinum DSM 44953 TaxID=1224162 RepID=A0A0B6TYY8_9CORY|nr:DUF3054 domain-containing protein [Corynebacterium marinum]AJK69886.1 hypothetical protein B840_11575 [Corynebacterium marinum DSM 44953]GGO19256.1 membrane protein [Corynebacterium marinum]
MTRISALSADVIAIAVFALFARIAHQTDDMPLNVAGWLSTLWPFLVGVALAWAAIALAGWNGARVAPAGVTTWVITAAVGLGIWSLRNGELPHWSFILVAAVMSGLLMLGWRAVAAAVGRRRT